MTLSALTTWVNLQFAQWMQMDWQWAFVDRDARAFVDLFGGWRRRLVAHASGLACHGTRTRNRSTSTEIWDNLPSNYAMVCKPVCYLDWSASVTAACV